MSGIPVSILSLFLSTLLGVGLFGQKAESYYREGLGYLKAKDAEKAYLALQKAFDLQADIPDLYPILAMLLEQKGNPGRAVDVLSVGARKYPHNAAMSAAMGRLHFNRDDLDRSVAAFRQAVELAPENGQYREQLSMSYYRKAAQEYEQQNFFESLSLARQGLELHQHEAEFHYLSGINLLALKKLTDAHESLRQAISLNPDRGHFHYYLGIVLFELDDLESAAPSLEKAVESNPDLPHARMMLGRVYGGLERAVQAVEQFQECLKLAPDFPQTHYYLGLAHRNLGDFRTAMLELEEAVASDPAHLPSRVALTELLIRHGNLQQAIEHLDHPMVAADGESEEILYLKAKTLVALARHDDAAEILDRLLQVEPGSLRVHYFVAQNYARLGKMDLARKHQKIAKELAKQ